MMKGKVKLIVSILLILLITIIGVTYAFYEYYRVGENHQLIVGNIYLKYNEDTDSINLSNVFPLSAEKARERDDNFITFTVSGINTTTNKDIWYEIILNEGDEETGMLRAKAEDLVFDLSEIDEDGNELLLVDAMSYDDINDRSILVNTVDRNTTIEVNKTYKLRMWLSEDVIISDTLENADYTTSDFANSYASAKVSVYGDFVEKELVIIGYVNYNVDGLGISKITSTPIYYNKPVTITTEVTSANVPNFLGWSTELNGEVMYLPGEEYSFNTNNVTLYPVLDLGSLLSDVIKENLSLTDADSDGVQFVTGDTNTANYVTYSGLLWRVVSVNSDGSVKLITQELYRDAATWGGTSYETATIHTWLNDTFLASLENTDTYLATAKWDYTQDSTNDTSKPTTTAYLEEKIGMLTCYEIMMIGNADSYLSDTTGWWTMTLSNYVQQGPGWYGWSFGSSGLSTMPVAYAYSKVRPSIVLVPGILISDVDGDGVSGDGTADSPYEITLQ